MTVGEPRRRWGLLGQRDFRLLWTGETISSVGSSVSAVALPLVALTVVHASTLTISVLTAAAWLPWLVIGLPAGAWVDRLRRRPVMITADLVSAAALLSLPITALVGRLTSPHLVIVALVTGASKVFFSTAYKAYLPSVIGSDDLLEGNAKLQGSEQVANLAGPGIAGVIAQASSALGGVVLDAASFLASAVLLRSVEGGESVRPRKRTPLRAEIGEGLRFTWTNPLLRSNVVFGCVSNFALTGYQSLLVVLLVGQVGLSAGVAGLLIGATSLGGIAGAALARPLAVRVGEARAVLLGKCALAPAGLLVAATTGGVGVVLFLVGSIVLFGGIVAGNVVYAGFVQRYIPPELMGRVSAGSQVVNFGAIPLGAVCAGLLATVADVRAALWTMLGIVAVSGTILLIGPMRRMRDFPCSDQSPTAVWSRRALAPRVRVMTVKLVVLYTQPDDAEAFDEHYLGKHGPLVDTVPGLQRWEGARFVAAADGGEQTYHRMAELYFTDEAAMQAALGSDEGKATAGDYQQIAPPGSRMFVAAVD